MVVGALLSASACDVSKELEISGYTMGTSYTVKMVDASGAMGARERRELRGRIEAKLERVNQQMSTYRVDSEISRFNRAPVGEWFAVSAPTERVVRQALALSDASDGAFDVTVGALVNLWGFGPTPGAALPPGEADIVRARKRVGRELLETRASPPALRRSADVYVDLSAIAKGFGVDQIAVLLEQAGMHDYLVEIGGELRVNGRRRDGERWRIGVQMPDAGEDGVVERTFSLSEGAVATSGDYRSFYERDGRRYGHIIDPRTGYPVHHALASVTVASTTAMQADALATALSVLGAEVGMRYATRHGIAALFIIRSHGAFEEQSTPQFAELLAEPKH